MKPFRKHVALSVDGGGIRGTMVAKALALFEEELGQPCHQVFQLSAGTSTGSIISAAIGARIPAETMHRLYVELGGVIFRKNWRIYWPLAGYKYPNKALIAALRKTLSEVTMGDFWTVEPKLDIVITVRDLVENRTRFVKSWKPEYQDWKAWYAVLCSSTVPTYFPVVDGRYVDGGVGSYTNPSYVAAYEAQVCLGWDPRETTLISIGTGRVPGSLQEYEADHFNAIEWVYPLIDTFLADASDQQVRLVYQFFPELDFRRFQVDLDPPIELDDPAGIPALTRWGEVLGHMILNDEEDEKAHREAGTAYA
jgi:predicted acylesterase/phospholipase RssA